MLLTACGGSGGSGSSDSSSSSIDAQLQALRTSGSAPTLDVSSTPGGVDADGNGIRDDLDRYLAAQTTTADQARAHNRMARALQQTLLVDTSDQTAVLATAQAIVEGIHCLSRRFPLDEFDARMFALQSFTVNTPQRARRYDAFNLAMNGSVSVLPSGVDCDA